MFDVIIVWKNFECTMEAQATKKNGASVCSKHFAIIIIIIVVMGQASSAGSLAFSIWIRWPKATVLNHSFGFGQLKYRLSFNYYNADVTSKTNFVNLYREIWLNLAFWLHFILHSILEISIKIHNLIITFQFQ